MHQVAKHRLTNIRTYTLANPGNEVKPDKGASSQQDHHDAEHEEAFRQACLGTGLKAPVNHQTQPLTDGQGNPGSRQQRQTGDDNTAKVGTQKRKRGGKFAYVLRRDAIKAIIHPAIMVLHGVARNVWTNRFANHFGDPLSLIPCQRLVRCNSDAVQGPYKTRHLTLEGDSEVTYTSTYPSG